MPELTNTRQHESALRKGFVTQDQQWTAVLSRDSDADGQFVYAVATTGVYCRPSCVSRKPNLKNVKFYTTGHEARLAGFRACKRCSPDKCQIEDRSVQVVAAACRILEASESTPSLSSLARSVGLSANHFHRLFRSVTGVTPKDYAAALRNRRLVEELRENQSVTSAFYDAGFHSSSRFYSQTKHLLGMTPTVFRNGGQRERIQFALGECSLGSICVASTKVGVCSISLGDDPEKLIRDLQEQFPLAALVGANKTFEQHVAMIVGFIESPTTALELPLDIRGTVFQRRVWDALTKTKIGETMSYSELAARLGMPKAIRAVASACAANLIALAIPCHRVVRSDGASSGYRWGIHRKCELLRREQNDG